MRKRHRINADVEQGAAAQRRVPQPVVRIPLRATIAQVGADAPHVADTTRGDDLAGLDDQGDEPHPHRLHAEDAEVTGLLREAFGVGERGRECLLAQHGLPRHRGPRSTIVGMLSVRRGHVDDIDVTVGEQVVDGTVGPLDVELVGEALGPLPRCAS